MTRVAPPVNAMAPRAVPRSSNPVASRLRIGALHAGPHRGGGARAPEGGECAPGRDGAGAAVRGRDRRGARAHAYGARRGDAGRRSRRTPPAVGPPLRAPPAPARGEPARGGGCGLAVLRPHAPRGCRGRRSVESREDDAAPARAADRRLAERARLAPLLRL